MNCDCGKKRCEYCETITEKKKIIKFHQNLLYWLKNWNEAFFTNAKLQPKEAPKIV